MDHWDKFDTLQHEVNFIIFKLNQLSANMDVFAREKSMLGR